METITVEQPKTAMEQAAEVSTREPEAPVSKAEGTVSDSAVKEPQIDWKARAEEAETRERALQSAKDRELKERDQRIAALQQVKDDAEEDRKAKVEADRLIEEGEDETQVRTFQEREAAAREARRKLRESMAKHNDTIVNTLATQAVLKRLVPEHDELLKQAVPYLVKLSKGKPEEIDEEMVDFAVAKFKKTTTPAAKPEVTPKEKPKSPAWTPSAQGTNNLANLSPAERVKQADKELRAEMNKGR